ncbi:MAG: hypothetical protein HEQ35_12755 [Gloeotrichia echinulata IR180]|nr:hypothetical protein [Gloeotrichia echinulata DEX184]
MLYFSDNRPLAELILCYSRGLGTQRPLSASLGTQRPLSASLGYKSDCV